MRRLPLKIAVFSAALATIMCAVENLGAPRDTEQTNYLVYIGTYDKGIYAYWFDARTAKLNAMGMVGQVLNPSFLATDRNYRFLYAVSEVEGKVNGGVAAFSIDRKNGSLKFLNSASSA